MALALLGPPLCTYKLWKLSEQFCQTLLTFLSFLTLFRVCYFVVIAVFYSYSIFKFNLRHLSDYPKLVPWYAIRYQRTLVIRSYYHAGMIQLNLAV